MANLAGFFKNFGSELKEIFNWTKGVSKELLSSRGELAYSQLNMAQKLGRTGAMADASRYTTGMLRSMGYGAAGGAAVGAIYGAGESMMDRSGSTGLISNMAKRSIGFGLMGGVGGGLVHAGSMAWNRSAMGSEVKWAKKFSRLDANNALKELTEEVVY